MAKRRDEIILGLDPGPYVRGLAKATTSTKAFLRELDSADSRMSNLTQSALALGPALVPIGAAAVPAVAALTAGLGAAAGAAVIAATAFSGIGDGLDALNKYQLEPTAENLAAVKQVFEELGPAGANFVTFLDKIEPKLDALQNAARAGLLPGVQEGIEALLERGPQAERIISEIAGALGDLAEDAGEGLAGPKFREFFDYIEDEARPILLDMGRTVGNVAEGLANLLVGFGPTTAGFSNALLDLSRDFAEWSRSLDENASFQEFLDYVQRVGPKVVDTFGSLVDALASIVKAAAPVGEVSLPIIEAVAETFAAIADSPAGPVLIAAAAGLSALSRAAALWNAANGGAIATAFKNSAEQGGKLAKTGERLQGIFSRNGALVGGVGIFALSMSDLDEKVGAANTAMGIMLGSLAGPWGAAIGGAIGFAKDFAAANDDVEDSMNRVNEAAQNPADLTAWFKALREAERALAKSRQRMNDELDADDGVFGGLADDPTGLKDLFSGDGPAGTWIDDFWQKVSGGSERAADGLSEFQREAMDVRQTLSEIRAYVKDPDGGFEHLTTDVGKLTRFAERAEPALRSMGISTKDLADISPERFREIAAGIREYNREADSMPGRTQAAREAIRRLDNPMIRASDAADDLEGALSALFDPQLNAREALIEWKGGLVELRKQIKSTNGTIDLNTEAGRTNQSMIIDSIRDLKDLASRQAELDGNSKRATKTLKNGRKAIIQTGIEAGISADDMRRLVNQMGLTPDLVKTKVTTPGAKDAQSDIETLQDKIKKVWTNLNIFIDDPGYEPTKGHLETLKNRQDKIDRQLDIHTAAPGADKAKRDIDGVRGAIAKMRDKGVDLTLTAKAENVVDQIDDLFNALPFANGGTVDYFANGDVRNGHTAQIAPAGAMRVWAEPETGGESYIPLAPSKRARSLDIWAETGRRLGVQGFADGDVRVGVNTAIGGNPRRDVRRIDGMFEGIADQFGRMASKALSKQVSMMNFGFNWPLPRQYGPSGDWGQYASGGSHPALDWPAPYGTPIYSVLPGRVADVQHMNTSYGNHTIVDHGKGLTSLYAHQARTIADVGDAVGGRQPIGLVNSTGNALDVETPVLTQNRGWVRHGDLTVGDVVYDENGSPVNVTRVAHWRDRPTYRVTFGDGSTIDADENHLWAVYDSKEKRRGNAGLIVKDTKALARTAEAYPSNGFARYSVPVAGPIENDPKSYTIDPYALGVWLGNGHAANARISFWRDDVDEMQQNLREVGETSRIAPDTGGNYSLTLIGENVPDGEYRDRTGKGQHPQAFSVRLKTLGLIRDKRIPQEYLGGSREQRMALLAGLIDTDGHVDPRQGTVEFCQASDEHRDLAYQVLALALSLGFKATLHESDATLRGCKTSTRYRVFFTPDVQVFRLKRKAEDLQLALDRRTDRGRTRVSRRYIRSVELVAPRDTNCITVDSESHLYLAGRTLIPTHNSTGNHLHLELRKNGRSFDYTSWLSGGGPRGGFIPGNYEGDHAGLDQASPGEAMAYARSIMPNWGWGPFQWPYWRDLGLRESGWRWNATNPSSGAYGIPQSLPPSKMASAGADWRTNVGTQLDWMAGYIKERYGGPYGAIQWHDAHNWYGEGGITNAGGINVFDRGGIWKHGQLGVNLSGRDEYVNDPQATAAAVHMANGGILDEDNFDLGMLQAFTSFVKWSRRHPDSINFPNFLGLSDREQNRLDRAGRRFNIGDRMSPAEVREEFRDIIDPIREVLGRDSGLIDAMKRFRGRIVDVSKAIEEERKERQKATERLRELRQRARDFAGTVTGNFRNDVFGGGIDELALGLRADRNDARTFDRALERAERRGLSGALFREIAESGNVELAQQFANASRARIRKLERLFEQRQRASRNVGRGAADTVFGRRLDRATAAQERQTIQLDNLIQRLRNIEDRVGDRVERGAYRGTKDANKDRRQRIHQFVKEARS